ncbi:MAG: protein kinase, partial [bacterium]
TILGTMQYMAPEQLEGKEVDVRADIFAFGAVVYEMATGKKAFEGSSNATLIAAVMERDPVSISAITPDTPPLFERLVRKCLAKDPDKRWQTVSDLLDELRWISQAGSQVGLPARIAARRKFKFDLARAIGLLTILTTAAFAYLYFSERMKPAPELPVARFTVNINQGLTNIFWPRISPDGRTVAFHADDSSGTNRIWVRPVNSLGAYPLLNTENAKRFFWSPDGKNVAFFVGHQLKRIPISGGQAQLVCQGPDGADGCWGTSDLIIFDGNLGDTLKIVAAGGGLPRPAALIDTTTGEYGYAWPWFLPDGKHFLFTCSVRNKEYNLRQTSRIKLGSVDATTSKTLYELKQNIDRVDYSNDGYILFVADDNLMGLPFDAEKLEVTGEPKPIAVKIGAAQNTYAFSVSNSGTLLYQTNNQSSQAELDWVDRTGNKLDTFGQPGIYGDVVISPDETKIAYVRVDAGADTPDIWIYDIKRQVPTRLTFNPRTDGAPVWSPDGKTIYFASDRSADHFGVYRKNASGLGDAEVVYAGDTIHVGPSSITADGSKLLVNYATNDFSVGYLNLAGESQLEPLIHSSFFEVDPAVSPNGRYVAYTCTESGRREVYVRRLDGTGGKWQISTEHAGNPKWNGDGTELYYLTFDGQIMAVQVSTGEHFEVGNPVELFEARLIRPQTVAFPYDVTADGQHFLLCSRVSGSDPGQIVVVQNWAEEFKER